MNEASRALEEAINSSHLGTRLALWTVLACASILIALILR